MIARLMVYPGSVRVMQRNIEDDFGFMWKRSVISSVVAAKKIVRLGRERPSGGGGDDADAESGGTPMRRRRSIRGTRTTPSPSTAAKRDTGGERNGTTVGLVDVIARSKAFKNLLDARKDTLRPLCEALKATHRERRDGGANDDHARRMIDLSRSFEHFLESVDALQIAIDDGKNDNCNGGYSKQQHDIVVRKILATWDTRSADLERLCYVDGLWSSSSCLDASGGGDDVEGGGGSDHGGLLLPHSSSSDSEDCDDETRETAALLLDESAVSTSASGGEGRLSLSLRALAGAGARLFRQYRRARVPSKSVGSLDVMRHGLLSRYHGATVESVDVGEGVVLDGVYVPSPKSLSTASRGDRILEDKKAADASAPTTADDADEERPASKRVVIICNPNAGLYECNHTRASWLEFYRDRGHDIFIYNYRGYGRSTGYPNPQANNSDGEKVVEHVRRRATVDHRQRVEIGVHAESIGGLVGTHIAHACPEHVTLLVADRTFGTLPAAAEYLVAAWTAKALRALRWNADNVEAFLSAPAYKIVAQDTNDHMIKDNASLKACVALAMEMGVDYAGDPLETSSTSSSSSLTAFDVATFYEAMQRLLAVVVTSRNRGRNGEGANAPPPIVEVVGNVVGVLLKWSACGGILGEAFVSSGLAGVRTFLCSLLVWRNVSAAVSSSSQGVELPIVRGVVQNALLQLSKMKSVTPPRVFEDVSICARTLSFVESELSKRQTPKIIDRTMSSFTISAGNDKSGSSRKKKGPPAHLRKRLSGGGGGGRGTRPGGKRPSAKRTTTRGSRTKTGQTSSTTVSRDDEDDLREYYDETRRDNDAVLVKHIPGICKRMGVLASLIQVRRWAGPRRLKLDSEVDFDNVKSFYSVAKSKKRPTKLAPKKKATTKKHSPVRKTRSRDDSDGDSGPGSRRKGGGEAAQRGINKSKSGLQEGIKTTMSSMLLKRGMQIEARFEGRRKWLRGKIARVRKDDTFDIRYENGDSEERVVQNYIRIAKDDDGDDGRSRSPTRQSSHRHDNRKTRSRSPKRKRRSQSRSNSSHRGAEPSSSSSSPESRHQRTSERDRNQNSDTDELFHKGMKVEARFGGKDKYYAGKITYVRSDGTFDILYEDGDSERRVKRKFIRPVEKKKKSSRRRSRSRSKSRERDDEIREGMKVEARFGGKDNDGTFDILYEDGDSERRVKRKFIRPVETKIKSSRYRSRSRSKSRDRDDELREGMKVEARFGGRDKFLPGKITYARSDGTFDILYEDGDSERRVKRKYIRAQKTKSRNRSRSRSKSRERDDEIREGMKVEARFGGKDKYYAGKITYVRSDGTFDILYEDGDSERRVKRKFIRPVETKIKSSRRRSRSRSKSRDRDDELREGMKVEARFGGKDKYYRGEITNVRRDGTFDIRYEDGDSERRVKRKFIRPVETKKKSSRRRSRSRSKSQERDDELREGMKVEARFGGKDKYYRGEITNVRRDGTFDIRYEDGDSERRVKRKFIRPVEKKKKTSRRRSRSRSKSQERDEELREGMKVEARFGGNDKYYRGEITNVRRGGTFDIRYEDGDSERRVKRKFIRALVTKIKSSRRRSRSRSKSQERDEELREGMKVEARFGAKDKYYRGEITSVRRDGTYDILYEDGDSERRVKRECVRVLKTKHISRRSHDTCDIFFDDGEEAYGVRRANVRRVDGKDVEERGIRSSKESLHVLIRLVGPNRLRHYEDLFDLYASSSSSSSSRRRGRCSMTRSDLVRLFGAAGLPEGAASVRAKFWTQDKTHTATTLRKGTFVRAVRCLEDLDQDEEGSWLSHLLAERTFRCARDDDDDGERWMDERWAREIGAVAIREIEASFFRHCVARLAGPALSGADALSPKRRPKKSVRLVLPVRRLRVVLLDVRRDRDGGGSDHAAISRGRVQEYVRDCGLLQDECLRLSDCAKAYHYLVTDALSFGTSQPTPFGRIDKRKNGGVPSLSSLAAQLFATHGSRGVSRNTAQMARQLSVGRARTEASVILRVADVFRELDPESVGQLSTKNLTALLESLGCDPASSAIRSQAIAFCDRFSGDSEGSFTFLEFVAAFGLIVEQRGISRVDVESACEFLRVRLRPDEFRTTLTTALTYVENILNEPTSKRFQKVRKDNRLYARRIGRFEGGEDLMASIGFVSSSPSSARGEEWLVFHTSSTSGIVDETDLDTLRKKRSVLETELSALDGGDGIEEVVAVLQMTHERDTVVRALECAMDFVSRAIRHPKDETVMKVEVSHPQYERCVAPLGESAPVLMAAVGFTRPRGASSGPYVLRGTDFFERLADEKEVAGDVRHDGDIAERKESCEDGTALSSLHLNLDETVGDLRERIEMQQGVARGRQKLVFQGRVLVNDDAKLRDLGIMKGSEVSLRVAEEKQEENGEERRTIKGGHSDVIFVETMQELLAGTGASRDRIGERGLDVALHTMTLDDLFRVIARTVRGAPPMSGLRLYHRDRARTLLLGDANRKKTLASFGIENGARLAVLARLRGGGKKSGTSARDEEDTAKERRDNGTVQVYVRVMKDGDRGKRDSKSSRASRPFKFPSLKPRTIRFLSAQRRRLQSIVKKLRDNTGDDRVRVRGTIDSARHETLLKDRAEAATTTNRKREGRLRRPLIVSTTTTTGATATAKDPHLSATTGIFVRETHRHPTSSSRVISVHRNEPSLSPSARTQQRRDDGRPPWRPPGSPQKKGRGRSRWRHRPMSRVMIDTKAPATAWLLNDTGRLAKRGRDATLDVVKECDTGTTATTTSDRTITTTTTRQRSTATKWSPTTTIEDMQFGMIRRSFDDIDRDGDGYLSRAEVRLFLRRSGRSASDVDVDAWIRVRDIDGDERVSFDEFLVSFGALLQSSESTDTKGGSRSLSSAVARAFGALRLASSPGEADRAARTCAEYICRILRTPSNSTFWSLSMVDETFDRAIGRLSGGIELMEALGFCVNRDGTKLCLPTLRYLRNGRDELERRRIYLQYPDVSDVASVSTAVASAVPPDCTPRQWLRAMEAVATYAKNVLMHPEHSPGSERFRTVDPTDPSFRARFRALHDNGGIKLLLACGFRESEDGMLRWQPDRRGRDDDGTSALRARLLEIRAGLPSLRKWVAEEAAEARQSSAHNEAVARRRKRSTSVERKVRSVPVVRDESETKRGTIGESKMPSTLQPRKVLAVGDDSNALSNVQVETLLRMEPSRRDNMMRDIEAADLRVSATSYDDSRRGRGRSRASNRLYRRRDVTKISGPPGTLVSEARAGVKMLLVWQPERVELHIGSGICIERHGTDAATAIRSGGSENIERYFVDDVLANAVVLDRPLVRDCARGSKLVRVDASATVCKRFWKSRSIRQFVSGIVTHVVAAAVKRGRTKVRTRRIARLREDRHSPTSMFFFSTAHRRTLYRDRSQEGTFESSMCVSSCNGVAVFAHTRLPEYDSSELRTLCDAARSIDDDGRANELADASASAVLLLSSDVSSSIHPFRVERVFQSVLDDDDDDKEEEEEKKDTHALFQNSDGVDEEGSVSELPPSAVLQTVDSRALLRQILRDPELSVAKRLSNMRRFLRDRSLSSRREDRSVSWTSELVPLILADDDNDSVDNDDDDDDSNSISTNTLRLYFERYADSATNSLRLENVVALVVELDGAAPSIEAMRQLADATRYKTSTRVSFDRFVSWRRIAFKNAGLSRMEQVVKLVRDVYVGLSPPPNLETLYKGAKAAIQKNARKTSPHRQQQNLVLLRRLCAAGNERHRIIDWLSAWKRLRGNTTANAMIAAEMYLGAGVMRPIPRPISSNMSRNAGTSDGSLFRNAATSGGDTGLTFPAAIAVRDICLVYSPVGASNGTDAVLCLLFDGTAVLFDTACASFSDRVRLVGASKRKGRDVEEAMRQYPKIRMLRTPVEEANRCPYVGLNTSHIDGTLRLAHVSSGKSVLVARPQFQNKTAVVVVDFVPLRCRGVSEFLHVATIENSSDVFVLNASNGSILARCVHESPSSSPPSCPPVLHFVARRGWLVAGEQHVERSRVRVWDLDSLFFWRCRARERRRRRGVSLNCSTFFEKALEALARWGHDDDEVSQKRRERRLAVDGERSADRSTTKSWMRSGRVVAIDESSWSASVRCDDGEVLNDLSMGRLFLTPPRDGVTGSSGVPPLSVGDVVRVDLTASIAKRYFLRCVRNILGDDDDADNDASTSLTEEQIRALLLDELQIVMSEREFRALIFELERAGPGICVEDLWFVLSNASRSHRGETA
eukprot:g758.t1